MLVKGLPSLTKLRLMNLQGAGGLMNLNPVGGSRALERNKRAWAYPCSEGSQRVHTILLEKDEVKEDIRFKRAPSGRALGSPQVHIWRQTRQMEYGAY